MNQQIRPDILQVPAGEDAPRELVPMPGELEPESLLEWGSDAPLGFSGPSGVLPSEFQESSHFAPVEDRWRIGFPEWDRDERPDPWVTNAPYKRGRLIDPYNQNVLKGDLERSAEGTSVGH